MAKRYKKKFLLKRGYRIATIKIDNHIVHLIKPLIWMNDSGVAVRYISKKLKDEILVIVDDINLPLGKMRMRKRGSDGGHLGLCSIIEQLETQNFFRLRIGIGRPQMDAASYVLSRFEKKERKILNLSIEQAIEGIEILVKDGFERAQNFINSI
jgi:PTH1 family peptidyl-tRNA hydrolase